LPAAMPSTAVGILFARGVAVRLVCFFSAPAAMRRRVLFPRRCRARASWHDDCPPSPFSRGRKLVPRDARRCKRRAFRLRSACQEARSIRSCSHARALQRVRDGLSSFLPSSSSAFPSSCRRLLYVASSLFPFLFLLLCQRRVDMRAFSRCRLPPFRASPARFFQEAAALPVMCSR